MKNKKVNLFEAFVKANPNCIIREEKRWKTAFMLKGEVEPMKTATSKDGVNWTVK